MADNVNSSNFMYASSGAKKKKNEAPRTEGGYLINQYRTGPSPTNMYRQSPRGNVPITKKERRQTDEDSPYTYQGYQVPMYSGSELVGLPAGTSGVMDGKVQWLGSLGNTQDELTKVLNYKTNQVRDLQKRLFRYGWIGKNSITGKATTESFQGAVAFLMQQGNRLGMNWEQLMALGPQGMEDAGGASTSAGSGKRYGVPQTNTQTSIDHATRGTARNFLKEALANVLGRGPEPGEFNEFLDLLRDKEEANPRVTTQTSVQNSADDAETATEGEGGLAEGDYANIAERFATQQDPSQAKRYAKAGYEQLLDQLIMGG